MMFTHLYTGDSIMVFKVILGEYKHHAVTETRESQIYEDKSHDRRAVEEEGFPIKSYQLRQEVEWSKV